MCVGTPSGAYTTTTPRKLLGDDDYKGGSTFPQFTRFALSISVKAYLGETIKVVNPTARTGGSYADRYNMDVSITCPCIYFHFRNPYALTMDFFIKSMCRSALILTALEIRLVW